MANFPQYGRFIWRRLCHLVPWRTLFHDRRQCELPHFKIDNYTSCIPANAGVTYHTNNSKESVALVFRNFGYQIKSYNEPKNNCLSEQISVTPEFCQIFHSAYTITYHDLQQFNISQSYDINGKEVGFGRKLMDHLSGGIELFWRSLQH